ncbi:MAG: hypothetical protein ACYS47_04015 [Planctomycetota bacterium]
MPEIRLTCITCHKTEEREDHPFHPGDELRLDVRIDDEKYFTIAVWKGKEFVSRKKVWINRGWAFNDQIEFRLVEMDGYTSDDTLGRETVTTAESSKKGTLRFSELGAEYTVEYILK